MSQPALDTGAFAEMKEIMGESFNEIITMCLKNLPEQLRQVKTAIEGKDAEALFNASHKMKSSCGTIGAFGLAEKIESIEEIGRSGSADVPTHLINDLSDSTAQVVSALVAEITT